MFPLYADNDADIKAFIEANSDVEVLNVVNDPVNLWAVIGDSLYTKKSSTLSVTFTSDCITELGYSVGRELYIDDIRYKESGYYDDTYYDKCIYRSDADYNLSGYLITEALDYNFPIDYNNDGRLDFVTYISLNLTGPQLLCC